MEAGNTVGVVVMEAAADVTLNKRQFAMARGVSVNTVDNWIAAGLPVVEGGSHGRGYAIDADAAGAWLEQRDLEKARARERAAQAVAQMRLELNPHGPEEARELTPAQRREEYEAQARYLAVAAQMRELVKADDVVATWTAALGAIRDAVDALPDALTRELGLTPEQTERVVEHCDAALTSARNALVAVVASDEDDGQP